MSKQDYKYVSTGYSSEEESVLLEAKLHGNYKKYTDEFKITKTNNLTGNKEVIILAGEDIGSVLKRFGEQAHSEHLRNFSKYHEKYRKQNIEEGLDS